MKRSHFSLRRQHFKRRPHVTEEEIERSTLQVSQLLQNVDDDLILNCDEPTWRLYPNNILTWWETGQEDVSIHIDGDEKGTMTVLATIWASRKKWPLFFVAKGKTARVDHSQIGDAGNNWRTHSESEWMRGDLLVEYLHRLQDQMPNREQSIYLTCDIHGCHGTAGVKRAASDLNIVLQYIWPGATDRLQLLDRYIFGALKSEACRLFRERAWEDVGLKRSKRDAVDDMLMP
jgi:hypothetical protein